MQMGMFGKLPAKGDFITRAVPPEILAFWERWLEKSVGGAKEHLGNDWQQAYQTAPVWRFWIGPEVFGHPLAGAWVASVDRVGRQFPLTLILSGAGVQHPLPPLSDPQDDWYGSLEGGLLYALSDTFDGDVDGWLAKMPPPTGAPMAMGEDRRNAFFAYGPEGVHKMFNDVSDHDHQLAALGRSYWWTGGNPYTGPAIIAQDGMPDASGFAAMLRGFGPPASVATPEPTKEQRAQDQARAKPARETTLPPGGIPMVDGIGGPGTAAAAAWAATPDSDSTWAGDAPAAPAPRARNDETTLPPLAAPAVEAAPLLDPAEDEEWTEDLTGEEATSPFGDDGSWAVPEETPLPEPAAPEGELDDSIEMPPAVAPKAREVTKPGELLPAIDEDSADTEETALDTIENSAEFSQPADDDAGVDADASEEHDPLPESAQVDPSEVTAEPEAAEPEAADAAAAAEDITLETPTEETVEAVLEEDEAKDPASESEPVDKTAGLMMLTPLGLKEALKDDLEEEVLDTASELPAGLEALDARAKSIDDAKLGDDAVLATVAKMMATETEDLEETEAATDDAQSAGSSGEGDQEQAPEDDATPDPSAETDAEARILAATLASPPGEGFGETEEDAPEEAEDTATQGAEPESDPEADEETETGGASDADAPKRGLFGEVAEHNAEDEATPFAAPKRPPEPDKGKGSGFRGLFGRKRRD